MTKHAAFTIISKNYFSFAKTLAESYKKHHPRNDFLIVLVDRADGYIPPKLACGAEVVELTDLQIPDLSRFIYRYTIIELNTAVKPYAIACLFRRREYDTLVYLDPDIWIFQPLTKVYEALDSASIVLIPHMRRPFFDNGHPNDTSILQSGTYNLGFLGLKRGESTTQMVDWWMTKLYRDCTVDIPNGLFVDQKWMDLVPGFFPDHEILYDRTYNVAYWNLHERRLTRDDSGWKVDGEPLVFFHFSGYSPNDPHTLSKHQNRHQLDNLPELKALTDAYAELLAVNGYEETSSWPYAFETLSNGIRLPLRIVRDIMQWASREKIPTPDPLNEPDAFCRFLMSRRLLPHKPDHVLLYHFLLQRRPDVLTAFPGAQGDSDDRGLQDWLKTSGIAEEKLADILSLEQNDEIADYVADAFHRLRKTNRSDVFTAFKKMWTDDAVFENFAQWFTLHGIAEAGFSGEHTRRIRDAKGGIVRILNIYFLHTDLQDAFPKLWKPSLRQRFVQWLREHQKDFDLSSEEISLFAEFSEARRDLIEKMQFLYQHCGRQRKKNFGFIKTLLNDFGRCSLPDGSPQKNFALLRTLWDAFNSSSPGRVVNFAGYLSAPSGMGESARSMLATLKAADVVVHPMTLPHPRAFDNGLPTKPALFGWPSSRAELSVTVVNADMTSSIETVLPSTYWAAKNIGYWVWETEELPAAFRKSERPFEEIWTPSNYSADGIRRTISKPVKVLPHTLDFAAIDRARSDRPRFCLPENGILFGFFFDPQSILERKNITGLLRAFRKAFRDDDNCYLVLKVNGKGQGAYDYEMVRAQSDWSRILFIEATFSREETYDFMKSLDSYVSLHRSEGFGLTCAEAMAMELPVVASKYSGNLDFMNDQNSLLVPTRVIETTRPYGPYPTGTRWGEPDLEAASVALRSLIDPEYRGDIGRRGAEHVHTALAPRNVGARLQALIEALTEAESGSPSS